MTTKRKSHSKQDALVALIDRLSAAEIYQSTSLEANAQVYGLSDRFILPRYEWHYLHGYADAIQKGWYRTHLIYAVNFQGTLYKVEWNTLPEEVRQYLRSTLEPDTGHYWLNKDGTIGRPYFTRITGLEPAKE